MLRSLHRAYSPVFLLDGLLERKLNVLNVLYLRTSSVYLRSLKTGDSKVMKLLLVCVINVCGDSQLASPLKIFSVSFVFNLVVLAQAAQTWNVINM